MKILKDFLNEMPRREQEKFAEKCGTTIGYLRKACYKNSELGTEISVAIEKVSRKKVTRIDLHPENYMKKWPELKPKRPLIND